MPSCSPRCNRSARRAPECSPPFRVARQRLGGLERLAVADSLVPVRPGEPGTRPFWNAHSKCFTAAPAFNFKPVPGAAEYRFTVKSKDGGWSRTFSASKPWACLAPVWKEVPVGQVAVEVEGVQADGQSVG